MTWSEKYLEDDYWLLDSRDYTECPSCKVLSYSLEWEPVYSYEDGPYIRCPVCGEEFDERYGREDMLYVNPLPKEVDFYGEE